MKAREHVRGGFHVRAGRSTTETGEPQKQVGRASYAKRRQRTQRGGQHRQGNQKSTPFSHRQSAFRPRKFGERAGILPRYQQGRSVCFPKKINRRPPFARGESAGRIPRERVAACRLIMASVRARIPMEWVAARRLFTERARARIPKAITVRHSRATGAQEWPGTETRGRASQESADTVHRLFAVRARARIPKAIAVRHSRVTGAQEWPGTAARRRAFQRSAAAARRFARGESAGRIPRERVAARRLLAASVRARIPKAIAVRHLHATSALEWPGTAACRRASRNAAAARRSLAERARARIPKAITVRHSRATSAQEWLGAAARRRAFQRSAAAARRFARGESAGRIPRASAVRHSLTMKARLACWVGGR